ncbi:hypothetical protein [Parasutterella sp.]|uniref:hypothetical protein n=1 Tax=Parasutterella sp. TaxID=2049037 RepID=UPI003AF1990B
MTLKTQDIRAVRIIPGFKSPKFGACSNKNYVPNMQGDFDGYFDFKTATGTFSTTNPNDTIQALTTGIQGNHGVNFNASKVNTIFGSSDTVQPKALRGYALIRYE